jgi:GTP-binding protein
LNVLAATKGLAHTSSTPGRTQAINFFRVEDRWCFVDLPGYGFARAPLAMVESWKGLAESYLKDRAVLALCVILLDARRGWLPKDLDLKQWLEIHKRRYTVVATKFDKLKSQKERQQGLNGILRHCGASPWMHAKPITFSAVTGQGVREIWQAISTILKRT